MADKRIIKIAGIAVDNIDRQEALVKIDGILKAKESRFMCFANAEAIVLARHKEKYRHILARASLLLPDGIGMQMAARLQSQRIMANLNGTDLFPDVCKLLNTRQSRVFLLGGKQGRAKKVGNWIMQNFPCVRLVGTRHGYFSKKDEPEIISAIRSLQTEVLFVGMGTPYQEIWIYKHLNQTGTKLAIGVGGLFDYYSGATRRAPVWMRKYCLEWVWRFMIEPRRWPRILRLIEFVWILLRYKDK